MRLERKQAEERKALGIKSPPPLVQQTKPRKKPSVTENR